MKVVVAHNRYASGTPSGENAVVDADIADLRAAGVEVLPFLRSSDSITSLSPSLAVSPLWSSQRALAALLRATRPDVVHLHNPYPLLSPFVIRTAHAHGVPVVQTVHNYRHSCVSGVYFRSGSPCTLCSSSRLPWPAVVHGCYRGSRPASLVMASALAAHRSTFGQVDLFLAPSPVVADHLVSYGVPAARIVVKPNAVPDPGPPAPLGDGFLFAGRPAPEKGLDLLLAAFALSGSPAPLRIAGAPSVASGQSSVEYLGVLPPSAVRDAIRSCAVVVVPSLWPEVLPTIALEALAAGRPVLGTSVGGIPFAIGEAGWTVPPTVDALASALPRALAEAPSLTSAARQRFLTHYHPRVVTSQLLAAYATLPAPTPPTSPRPPR